jgi:ribosome-binding protein aMBF1 (putative translation factor)
MIQCDLCGKKKQCRPREIEGKEYDICSECWTPFARRLKGKGRKALAVKGDVEMIVLPQQITIPAPEAPQRLPGGPPKIWSGSRRPH